jgi:hypothetical protein
MQIILTDFSASDPRFKAVVKDASRNLVAESTVKMLDDEGMDGKNERDNTQDFVFGTAKVAAEFTKRGKGEGPVRCRESEEGKRAREALEKGER